MILFSLAFFAGDLFLQTLSAIPKWQVLSLSLMLCLFLYFIFKKHRHIFFYLLVFFAGFFWSLWYATGILSWSLPKEWEGRPLIATGYIASLPVINKWQTSFIFSLQSLEEGKTSYRKKTLVRLSSSEALPKLKPGDRWRFHVKLKRIYSTQNPGGFDFEKWAFEHGLRATGYIIAGKNRPAEHVFLSHSWFHSPIDQMRYALQQKILLSLPNTSTAPWLMALILGERHDMAQADWQVLRQTGTNHLMAIAGLHIGLLAGLVHVIAAWCWRRFPALLLIYPAHLAAAVAALISVLCYSMLAGFSIPTERAAIMFTVFVMTTLKRKKLHAWQIWSTALFIVLVISPLSLLSDSFYLSFGTIALIIFGMHGRLSPTGWWWKWGRVQWVIGLGLVPLSLLLFQECSIVSLLANCIAIPYLGFLILPLCFLSIISLSIASSLTAFFLYLADKMLTGLWAILTWFSQLPIASWHQAVPGPVLLILSIISVLLLLLPAGFPGRMIGMIWMLPLIFYQPERPKEGHYWVTLLDVGQGLSLVVQTKQHVLVYDAGPAYHQGSDLGKSVVVPYLYTLFAKKIDMVVISHGDNDHIGGARALIEALPVGTVKSSVPEKLFYFSHADYCLAGNSWRWEGVNFSFIYPTVNDLHLNNDSSCVLKIDNGTHRTLLTGDIEKYAEEKLLAAYSSGISADLLVAPHHGSKTSGLYSFISTVHPSVVLYATGYKNRYHFPHESVVKTYTEQGIQQLNTVNTGAIQFKFGQETSLLLPSLYRKQHRHYWQ